MTDKLHLQRWIEHITEDEDGNYQCKVSFTITSSRQESVTAIQSTPLATARHAYKQAKAFYEDRIHNYYLKRGYEETDEPFRKRGVYEVQRNGHLLAWNRNGWHCKHCGDVSYYLPSSDHLNCPKVKRYRSWEDIPENLKTKNQLYELGYSKGKTKLPEAEGAIAWHDEYGRRAGWRWVFVYPVEKAVKRKVTSAQEKALKKAHRAKGSSLKIIKAVTDILPSDYVVSSDYKENPEDWFKFNYTLTIKLEDIVVYDIFLGRSQKGSIEKATYEANRILLLNDLYHLCLGLLDWSNFDLYIYQSEYSGKVRFYVSRANSDEDEAKREYTDIEIAKQMIPLDVTEMVRELP